MSSLNVSYDGDADVLYLALGQPVPALTDEDDHGLLVRHAVSDGHACGVTVLGFHRAWQARSQALSELVGRHLHVSPKVVLKTIRSV